MSEAERLAQYLDYAYPSANTRKEAAALLRQQAAEIERLTSLADSEGTRAVEYLRRLRKAKSELNTQVALVEKCMVAMNENADRGQKAEAECDALRSENEALRREAARSLKCLD